jgi:protein SCO1
MSRTIVIGATAVLGAMLAGTYVFTLYDARSGSVFAPCLGGQVAGGDIGGPFALVDENGATVTDTEVITAPTLVYFGYTFCPDICPTDTQRNAFATELLEEREIVVNPVFITFDPERDTADVLRAFTAHFHPRLLGLTGSTEQVDAAVRAYRAQAIREEGGDPDYYLISHTSLTYLMLPGHGFVDFFPSAATPEEVADRAACFIEAAGRA